MGFSIAHFDFKFCTTTLSSTVYNNFIFVIFSSFPCRNCFLFRQIGGQNGKVPASCGAETQYIAQWESNIPVPWHVHRLRHHSTPPLRVGLLHGNPNDSP